MDFLQDVQKFLRATPRTKLMFRTIILLVLCVLWLPGNAQVDNVMVYGTVKDMSTAKKLDGVTIVVFKNGSRLVEVVTNASGKYEVNLDYGASYKVECTKSGFVGKNISIDTRNVPEEERLGGHGMNIDFTMMVELQGVDYSVLMEPFGMASYVKASGNFEWDMEYTSRMRDAQARLLKEYEDRKKREANAEAEFAKLMQQGDAAMVANDYKKAVDSFSSALELKPGDAIATAKLSDARMGLDAQDGAKKIEEQYAELIKAADQLFTKKEYEASKAKYDEAIDVKDDPYPKGRIKEIDVILADLAKKAEEERLAKELQEKYQAAITAADAAFNTGKWDQSEAKYNEAIELKPAEKYPKDQLAAIVKKREEESKKAEEERLAKELQEKYQAAISAGDAAFKASDWEVAIGKYTEAGGLKPEERYPKDQLAAIEVKKKEAADKAEADRLAQELDAQYQAAIAAADAAFKSADYDAAKAGYNAALELKSAERYPKDQLAAIDRKLEELKLLAEEEEKARELNERYAAAIATADASFGKEEWERAIEDYTKAGELKPAETYPKDRIAAIRAKQEELARAAEEQQRLLEMEERYTKAIEVADKAFKKEDWDAARTAYTDASGIKPTEQYPKDQLEMIQVLVRKAEEQMRREELDAKYQGLIDEADNAFQGSEWQLALTKYKDALGVKPDEIYPKDRITELNTLMLELERQAEEERKQKELQARYEGLVAKADQAFDKEQWSAALNDYKDARQLKPEEPHPQERITAIEMKMDAAAQAKAEEERLAREKQELDRQYNELIALADKAFGAKRYEEARTGYTSALGIKPEEQHPQERLAEIDRLEAAQLAQAEADSLAAVQAAEEKARLEEEARLAALAAADEKARLEEEERLRKESEAEREARFRELVNSGDAAYADKELDRALSWYRDALGVKPGAPYPTERIAAIENEIQAALDAERMAEEARRAAEEQALREKNEEEAARLAAERERERLEEERLRKEREEAEARRLAEEQERMAREAAKAVEERYRTTVIDADAAFALKDYLRARGLYAQASDIKPEETYPVTKIEQIDQMLAEQERLREEAELAARLAAEKAEAERARRNSRSDSRKEQEAEQFMRDAREREEAEKYERIRRFRSDLIEREEELAGSAAERRMEVVSQKDQYQDATAGLYEGDEARRIRNAEEMAAFKEAVEEEEQRRVLAGAEVRDRHYDEKLMVQERGSDRAAVWEDRQEQRTDRSEQWKENVQEAEARRASLNRSEILEARENVLEQAEQARSMDRKAGSLAEEMRRKVEEDKRAQQAREAGYAQASELSRTQAKARLDRIPPDQPRAFADYNRSQLAMDYPPGVTEESYTEGNKVIIRRIVVNGNRADEYSKVIAKWGTFYFKNGQSITEAIWSKETEG